METSALRDPKYVPYLHIVFPSQWLEYITSRETHPLKSLRQQKVNAKEGHVETKTYPVSETDWTCLIWSLLSCDQENQNSS